MEKLLDLAFAELDVLAGHGIVRARGLGFATLVAILFLWAGYSVKNDKENAIKNLEKAVQLDPNNQQAKRMLDQLKASK